MWTISPLEVSHLRGAAGEHFVSFVDSLLRSHLYLHGVPDAKIRTNLRTIVPDGGVDTELLQAVPDDETGWCSDSSSIWQYKATDVGNIGPADLRTEVNKAYARERIAGNAAYRLCVCDEITAEKKNEMEGLLCEAIRAINLSAPMPRVLSAGDLAPWASRVPAVVLQHFHPQLAHLCLHLYVWGRNMRQRTPVYIPFHGRDPIVEHLTQHISFDRRPPTVVLPILGDAGVGKTRLVYEVLASSPGASGLVLYADDERNASEIARMLANDPASHGLLVADECTLETRVRLQSLLGGSSNRVRVVAIDNTALRGRTETPESWLEILPQEVVLEIVGKNFPEVPADRRRAYTDLAGGFVLLAADLCRNDALIASSGLLGPGLNDIRRYLSTRLNEEELRVLQALSMVIRVGMSEDVSGEISALCAWMGLEPVRSQAIAQALRDGTGFVTRGGRYFYVTPEVIARAAFDLAWRGLPSPMDFLYAVPAQLLEQFMKRVARSAADDVREVVGRFFLELASRIRPGQLAQWAVAETICILTDLNPNTYLPLLRNIVESAKASQLRRIRGDSEGGRWGPRRSLVWLLERMVGFSEYFEHCEGILFKLAIAESEPAIANNATAIWSQLYRVMLSGTEVPFLARLKKLEQRIFSGRGKAHEMAVIALREVFGRSGIRVLGPTVVAGRIRPEDWKPATPDEAKMCWDAAVALMTRMVHDGPKLKSIAREVVLQNMRTFLTGGYFAEVKAMFPVRGLHESQKVRLLEVIEDCLRFDFGREIPTKVAPSEYASKIAQWAESLRPRGLHGQTVELIGIDRWHHAHMGDEERWGANIFELAGRFIRDPESFRRELNWLMSPEAKNADTLGLALAKLDGSAAFLELIVGSAPSGDNHALVRGYIAGLSANWPTHLSHLNALLDELEKANSQLACDLGMAGGKATRALERVLRQVDAGQLPARYLRAFGLGYGNQPLEEREVEQVLSRLVPAVEHERAIGADAIEFVGFLLHEQAATPPILTDAQVRRLVWQLIKLTAMDGGSKSYWWLRIVKGLAVDEPEAAIQAVTRGLVGDDLLHSEGCEALLIEFSKDYAKTVVETLGSVILDKEAGWRFRVGVHKELVNSLPTNLLIEWVASRGVEAARRLAGHLPRPYIDKNGNPVVPVLTEFVLKTYAADEQTFREFCTGLHSFQIYSGDIAAQHLGEAEVAKKFLGHPVERIRQWAQYEIESSLHEAERHQREDEERQAE